MIFDDYIDNELSEAIKKKYVIRKGKRVGKWTTTKKGKYRIEFEDGKPKEVRITATERRKRKQGQKKGKLKRKAKMGLIELKRKRSFIARRNTGLKYVKSPESQGPAKISQTSSATSTLRPTKSKKTSPTIHPVHESLLYESPHSYLFTDDRDIDYFWDFYAEAVNDSSWLEQIIDIYTKHQVISLEPDANNRGYGDIVEFGPEYLPEITFNLMNNIEFLCTAAKDYLAASQDLQDRFRNKIPAKLFNAILPYIERLESEGE